MINTSQLRESDAPIAMGRSGIRSEKGLSTSGLIGERLMDSSDPKFNSYCQRAWLYTDDPALLIKKNGRPVSASNNQVSLDIGSDKGAPGETFTGWNHGRKAVLTGTATFSSSFLLSPFSSSFILMGTILSQVICFPSLVRCELECSKMISNDEEMECPFSVYFLPTQSFV